MKLASKIILYCLCMVLLLSACAPSASNSSSSAVGSGGGSQSSGAQQNTGAKKATDYDTLTYAMNTEPSKLDPQSDALLNTMLVNKQIYNTLMVREDGTGAIKPSLATNWEWKDDLTLAVTLRDDVYFHNGDKLTAEDVVYTVKRFSSGAATASLFASFDGENTKVIDETHLEIKLKEPYGPALNLLTSMKAAIVSKNYCESVDENTFTRQPIGSGPFKFVNWVSGDRINLVRNDEYWGDKPSYQNLVMRVIVDPTARAIELETGGVDIIDTLNGSDADRFADGKTAGVNLHVIPSFKIHYLVFNETDPILSNEKVRLAIAHAIEIGPITEAAFGSTAVAARSSMASTVFGFKDTGPYEYNPEKARQLLAEAGYPDGFSCEIVIPDPTANVRTAEAVQAYLADIGIDMGIKTYDAATWQTMSRDGTAKFSIQNLTADTADPDHSYMNLYDNSALKTARTSDATVNRLLREGRAELDTEKRKAIYAELQDYIFDHAIWIPIDEISITYGVRDYIQNFTPDAGVQANLAKVVINH